MFSQLNLPYQRFSSFLSSGGCNANARAQLMPIMPYSGNDVHSFLKAKCFENLHNLGK